MKTKIPSPSKSQGAHTPRRKSRRTLSVGSPALSTASGRLTSVVQGFVNKQMNSFALSPLPKRRSVLTDNTDIVEEPRRKSWWKNLNENSRNVLEILDDNNIAEPNNIIEELDIEILSQEKRNYTLDIPESSDGESIHSIVLPQRNLFTQKESQHQKFGQIIGTRESMSKSNKNMTINDKVANTGTKELFQNKPRSKLLFPTALLEISPDKTIADKTKEFTTEPKTQARALFGNHQGTKRKNMFADFIATESDDEISEIQPRIFGFPKKLELMRRGSSASRGIRESSPTSNITTDTEMDEWRLLPSSTMVENQLEAMMEENTPKKPRLSKLTETKESSGTSAVFSKTKSPELNTSVLTRSRLRSQNNSKTSIAGGKDKTQQISEQNQSKRSNQHNQSLNNKSKDKLKEANKKCEQNKDQNRRISDISQEKMDKSKGKLNKSRQKSRTVTDGNESQAAVENEEDEQQSQAGNDRNRTVKVALEVNQSQRQINNLQIKKPKVTTESQEVEESEEVTENKNIDENKEIIDDTEEKGDENQESESKNEENESQEVAEESDNEEVEEYLDQINESQEQDDENIEQANESQEHFEESMEQEDEMETAEQSQSKVDESNEAINQSRVDENDEEIDKTADKIDASNEVANESNEVVDESKEIADESEEENEEDVDESNQAADENNEVNQTREEVDESTQVENESQLAIEDDGNEDNHSEIIEEEVDESNAEENKNQNDDENEDIEQEEIDESNIEENESENDENEAVEEENESQAEEDDNEDIEHENTQKEVDESDVEDEAENAELHYESASEEMEINDEPQNDENETPIEQDNITNTPEPTDNETNISHDTTGRNRIKHTSPEVILHDKARQSDSFSTRRNTSIRKTKSIANLLNDKPSLMPARDSVGFSDGTTNSSAEGSGWDSHRTTRKTIRQTFGRDATPRKSLRALVMEKSAKRHTLASETAKFPLANSTAVPEISLGYLDIQPIHQESTHEVSLRTRQLTLDAVLEKIKEDNLKKKAEIEESVKKSLESRSDAHIFKVPHRPMFPRRQTNKENKPSSVKAAWRGLPEEMIQDLQYRPPKRFQPSNAPWITKRLYNYLEKKLEPKYDYKARVRSEKLVETLYNFTKDLRRQTVATEDATSELKHEMARLQIVRTHHDYYEFFRQFMPKEIRIKVIPDVVNKIPLPRRDVFSDIIVKNSSQG